MLDPLVDPGPVEAVASYVDAALAAISTGMPAVVTRFDSARQSVDAQPLVQYVIPDESGNRVVKTEPAVTSVPVVFQRGSQGGLEFPLAPGDVVLLVTCSRSIQTWWRSAGPNAPTDPELESSHDLDHCIAIPCARRSRDAIADFTGDAVVLRAGGVQNEVRLGGPSASADSNRVVVQSALDVFAAAINAAIATLTTSANPAAGPALLALQTLASNLNITPTTNGWSAGTAQTKAG